MNVAQLPQPQERYKTLYNSSLGIKKYGEYNLYPNAIRDILRGSPTGTACFQRFASFLFGSGFSGDMAKTYANKSQTFNDILRLVSADFGQFGGFALHCNYNILGEVAEVQHIPFEMVRIAESDDAGYVAGYYVHPDWSGRTTRNGKRVVVNKENAVFFNKFNPDKEVVFSQMQTAGGLQFYKGQVLYFSNLGVDTYPLPIYDASVNELSTEEGLGNIKLRNVRNNFFPSGIAVFKSAQTKPDELVDGIDYSDEIARLQGDTKVGKMLSITIDSDEQLPHFVEFPAHNFDKDFQVTDTSVVERIYAAFGQEVFYCIRIGKTGFSGDVVSDAYSYYSSYCRNFQQLISQEFSKVLQNSIFNFENISIKRIEL